MATLTECRSCVQVLLDSRQEQAAYGKHRGTCSEQRIKTDVFQGVGKITGRSEGPPKPGKHRGTCSEQRIKTDVFQGVGKITGSSEGPPKPDNQFGRSEMASSSSETNMFSMTETHLKKISDCVKENLQIAKDSFKDKDGSVNLETLGNVCSLLGRISEALPKFTSGDTKQILLGLAGIVSAVMPLSSIVHPALPIICEVVSKVFSYFGGNKITVGNVVENEIRRVFGGYCYESLLEKAEGLHFTYQLTYDFLKSASHQQVSDISQHDITNLNIQMNVFRGAEFLHKLGKLIKNLAKEHTSSKLKKKTAQAREAMVFIDLYATLALLRDMILWHFFVIANSTGHSQLLANCIQQVIASFNKQDSEALSMFLEPTSEYLYIVSYACENSCAHFDTFLEQKRLVQDLSLQTGTQYSLHSVKWPSWMAIRQTGLLDRLLHTAGRLFEDENDERNLEKLLCGSEKRVPSSESLFCFEKIQGGKNYFYIIKSETPGERVSMTNDSNRRTISKTKTPERDCVWKVIQMKNGNYVFSPVLHPGYFMGMENDLISGDISGFLGGDNQQIQWQLRAV